MRRTFNLRLVSEDNICRLMVPGDLTFGEFVMTICELFDIDTRYEHLFVFADHRDPVGVEDLFTNIVDEDHAYLSGCIKVPIRCKFANGRCIDINWEKETKQDLDCPRITQWTGSPGKMDQVNEWLEDEYFLLSETDGNPKGKRNIFRDELMDVVADALLSPKKLTFYGYIPDSALYVLEKDGEYRSVTKEEVEDDRDFILIREAEDIHIFDIASEFTHRKIDTVAAYKKFISESGKDPGWNLFLRRNLRELLRKWVKTNDLWIDCCDLGGLMGGIW